MDTATHIEMAGRFDVHRVGELREAARHAKAVAVGLARTEFLDNHAIDALEELGRRLGGALALVDPSLTVRITLELTGRLAGYAAVTPARAA